MSTTGWWQLSRSFTPPSWDLLTSSSTIPSTFSIHQRYITNWCCPFIFSQNPLVLFFLKLSLYSCKNFVSLSLSKAGKCIIRSESGWRRLCHDLGKLHRGGFSSIFTNRNDILDIICKKISKSPLLVWLCRNCQLSVPVWLVSSLRLRRRRLNSTSFLLKGYENQDFQRVCTETPSVQ